MGHIFENIDAWKRSCQLATEIYKEIHKLDDWDLRNQMRRCAVSIPSNIAEGSAKDSDKDFIRYLRISKGSSAELRTQLYLLKRISTDLDLPPIQNIDHFIQETKEISSMLQGLIRHLTKQQS